MSFHKIVKYAIKITVYSMLETSHTRDSTDLIASAKIKCQNKLSNNTFNVIFSNDSTEQEGYFLISLTILVNFLSITLFQVFSLIRKRTLWCLAHVREVCITIAVRQSHGELVSGNTSLSLQVGVRLTVPPMEEVGGRTIQPSVSWCARITKHTCNCSL